MDKILPPEILIKIFLNLPFIDLQAVTDTCVHWKSIVESYQIWRDHWLRLLNTTSNTNLKDSLYVVLKQFNSNELNFNLSCTRLKNVLHDGQNHVYKCLIDNGDNFFQYGVLKTHHKIVILRLMKKNIRRNYIKHLSNDAPPNCKSYMLFRSPPKFLKTLDIMFQGHAGTHRHVKSLMYMYPLGATEYMETVVGRLLGPLHVTDLVLVPRVLVLCENLGVADALVVFSTSRSTEVALVIGGCVEPGRWVELPVGGWQVAQNLHSAFTWLHPDAPADPQRFDESNVKALCWLRMPQAASRRRRRTEQHVDPAIEEVAVNIEENYKFVLKDEQYLAPELMYAELGLMAVVQQLAVGLSDEQLERCLAHVLLTGGNCKLRHLHVRVRLELMAMWPQHAATVHTSVHEARILAYCTPVGYFKPMMPPGAVFLPGRPCRITRELYIHPSTST